MVNLDVLSAEATAIGEVKDQVLVADSALTSAKYDFKPKDIRLLNVTTNLCFIFSKRNNK